MVRLLRAWCTILGAGEYVIVYRWCSIDSKWLVQAHFSQLTEIGWTMLPTGNGSGIYENILIVTFVSPSKSDFTIVIRGDPDKSVDLTFAISPTPSKALHLWTTQQHAPFQAGGSAQVVQGLVHVVVPMLSVVSLTTIDDACHTEFPIPQRSSFPLPYFSNFDAQSTAAPVSLDLQNSRCPRASLAQNDNLTALCTGVVLI